MTLTKDDRMVLKILVEKELQAITKEGKNLISGNTPLFPKEPDIAFLKSEALYEKFLQQLRRKL